MKSVMPFAVLILLLAVGCTTRSKARANAREAYLAGQQQALAGLTEARRVNIRFVGPLQHPEVVWSPGLTLLQAIAAAEYTDARDPNIVVIIRQRERINISPRDLLSGKDWELEPGDTVEIHP